VTLLASLQQFLDTGNVDHESHGSAQAEPSLWNGLVGCTLMTCFVLNLLLCAALAFSRLLPESTAKDSSPLTREASRCEATRSQKAHHTTVLHVFCFAAFCDNLVQWMICPFLPSELRSRGVGAAMAGLIFGVYSLVKLTLAWPAVFVIKHFGPWNVLLVSSLMVAIPKLCFSCAGMIASGSGFASACLSLRVLTGVAALLTSISIRTILVRLEPDNISSSMGAIGVAEGLGTIAGPALGAVLFQQGSYPLCFGALGCVQVLNVLLLRQTKRDADAVQDKQDEPVHGDGLHAFHLLSLMLRPRLLSTHLVSMCSASMMTATEVTLQLYLHAPPISASPLLTSLPFFCVSVGFVISSGVAGALDDGVLAWSRGCALMIPGMLLGALAMVLIAPACILGLQARMLYACLGAFAGGASTGAVAVPLMKRTMYFLSDLPQAELPNLAAGIIQFTGAGTAFLGSIAGANFEQAVGASCAYSGFGILALISLVPIVMQTFIIDPCKKS